ncbi:MAG: amino acid--tRNA ligase-related protein, partial [Patescibacteria group bacterium]
MLDDLRAERVKKLITCQKRANPYPATVRRDSTIGDLLARFPEFEASKRECFMTGRLTGWRDQGKIAFGDLEDESGKLQIVLDEKETEQFNFFKEVIDVGDFVEAGGIVLTTKRGERSLAARHIRVITKSLRPLPVTWYGLDNVEERLRKRYLDALTHPEVRELFKRKNQFWETVRTVLKKERFFEVETPVLEAVPGGAEAEPFVTHLNALDEDL